MSERTCAACGSIIEFPLFRGQKPRRDLLGWCIDCNSEVATKPWKLRAPTARREDATDA